jgi:hypothetical protein
MAFKAKGKRARNYQRHDHSSSIATHDAVGARKADEGAKTGSRGDAPNHSTENIARLLEAHDPQGPWDPASLGDGDLLTLTVEAVTDLLQAYSGPDYDPKMPLLSVAAAEDQPAVRIDGTALVRKARALNTACVTTEVPHTCVPDTACTPVSQTSHRAILFDPHPVKVTIEGAGEDVVASEAGWLPVRNHGEDEEPLWLYCIYNPNLKNEHGHVTLLSDFQLLQADKDYELRTKTDTFTFRGVSQPIQRLDNGMPHIELLLGEDALLPDGTRGRDKDVDVALYKEKRSRAAGTYFTGTQNNTLHHQILGHRSKRSILSTLRVATGTSHLPPPTTHSTSCVSENCGVCAISKIPRPARGRGQLGLSLSLFHGGPSIRPGQVLCADAKGPFPPSINGSTYLVVLVDVGSGTILVEGHQGLKDIHMTVVALYRDFRTRLPLAYQNLVSVLVTDGAPQLVSQEATTAYRVAGVVHRTSIEYFGDTNPYAETGIKVIWHMALPMLLNGFWAQKWWLAHTKLAAALHFEIVNSSGFAPCQLLLERLPDLSGFVAPSGTLVYIYVPEQRRQPGQFKDKGEAAVLLGPAQAIFGSTQGFAVYTRSGRLTAVPQVLPVYDNYPFREQAIARVRERDQAALGEPTHGDPLVYEGYYLPDLVHRDRPLTVRKRWDRWYKGDVVEFDPHSRLFLVTYEDGDEETYTAQELFEILDPAIEQQTAERSISLPTYATSARLVASAFKTSTVDATTPSWKSAISGPLKSQWRVAAAREFDKLLDPNDPVLRFEPYPNIGSGIEYAVYRCVVVCKIKNHDLHHTDAQVLKVRFCCQGNYTVIFKDGIIVFKGCPDTPSRAAPGVSDASGVASEAKVVRTSSLPVLAIVGMNAGHDPPSAGDVTSAFTQQHVPGDVYIYLEMPPGSDVFKDPTGQNRPCRMVKWLYGHRLANFYWAARSRQHMERYPLRMIDHTGCVGVHGAPGSPDFCAQAITVDDVFVVAGNTALPKLREHWSKIVTIDFEPRVTRYAGINFSFKGTSFSMDQCDTIEEMCGRHGIDDSYKGRLYGTPLPTGFDIRKEDSPAEPDPAEVKRAQAWIGELSWLASKCRPDLLYTVSIMARVQLNPGKRHFEMLRRATIYLWATRSLKLVYHKGPWEGPDGHIYEEHDCGYFPDAAVGVAEGYHSQTGYASVMGGAALAGGCKSSRQSIVADSSGYSETLCLTEATHDGVERLRFLQALGLPTRTIIMNEDNTAALTVGEKGLGPRSLHWNIKVMYIKEQSDEGTILLRKLHTAIQPGDIFTKILDEATFTLHRFYLFGGGTRLYRAAKLGVWADTVE